MIKVLLIGNFEKNGGRRKRFKWKFGFNQKLVWLTICTWNFNNRFKLIIWKSISIPWCSFLVGITTSQAQRMLPKQKGLEINTGVLSNDKIGNDYYINIGMTVNGKNGNYQLWALEYTHQYTATRTATYYKKVILPRVAIVSSCWAMPIVENITLNAGITGVVGYENINRGETMLYDGAKILSEDNFIYGAGGRLTFETYLSDRFVLILQGHTKVFWGTNLQQFRPSASVGLRFNF